MQKLFLLIIASWATSCLPASGTQRFSSQASTTALTEKKISPKRVDEFILANSTLTKSFKELEKEATLTTSGYHGVRSGLVGVGVSTVGFLLGSIAFFSGPFIVLGLGTAAACSLVQDIYCIDKDDKKNTTSKDRALAHAKGIGLVNVVAFSSGLSLRK